MGRLSRKVTVVTGAGSGIGRAVAVAFADEGARLVVNDWRTDGEGEATVAAIKTAGGDAVYFSADVSHEEEVRALIQTALTTFGRLDVMVNNAGLYVSKPLEELTEYDFDRVTSVNQKGTFFGTKHAALAMKASGGGSIINTASIAADHGQRGSFVYGATKGAILTMTRVAAVELAEFNIRVNAVQPGVIESGIANGAQFADPAQRLERIMRGTPLGHRKGTPGDCTGLYIFLASDESAFITGQKMAVDGGILAESHII
jgi:NAD(P)-dependent dehydrogenase (short-subunit alcohol dehydrogenase family)